MGLSWLWSVLGLVMGVGMYHLSSRTFPVHSTGGIVVTGASSGIGLDAALALDALGYVVFPTVRKQADADALRQERPSLHPIIVDVTSDEQVASGAATVASVLAEKKLNLIGLVNNAGISHRLPLEADSIDRIKAMYDVNVFGLIRATQAFVPMLRQGKGRIVNVGSVAGLLPHLGSGAYSGTKAAVEVMSDVLRMEMQPFDISVSLIEPAYVKTQIAAKQLGDNSPVKHCDPDKIKLYPWLEAGYKNREKNEALASPVNVTTDAIVDALTSAHPKTRYVVANVGGKPAWLVTWVGWLAPDRIQDILTTR